MLFMDSLPIGRVDPEGVESLFAFLFSWFQGGIRERKVVSKSLHVPSRPGGTHAYLVTKQGAKKLLELLPKANYHVDMVVSKNCPISLNKYCGY